MPTGGGGEGGKQARHGDWIRQQAGYQTARVPPEPGTAPIPPGTIRLYHFTSPDALPAIQKEGLLRSMARGDAGGGPTEESAGVWASATKPSDYLFDNRPVVEFAAKPEDISDQASSPWRVTSGLESADEFAARGPDVIMKGDVKPSDFLAVHEPWHGTYRALMRDYPSPDSEALAKMGGPTAFDWMKEGDNADKYGRAVDLWKQDIGIK